MRAWKDRRLDDPSIDGEVITLSYIDSIDEYKMTLVCRLRIDVEKWEERLEVIERPHGMGRIEYSLNANVVGLKNALEWGEDAIDKIYDELERKSKKARQRTGFKDLNGEEMCVGDIVYGAVNRDNTARGWFHDAEIISKGGKFLIKLTANGDAISIDDKDLEFIKVIGDVDYNPGLWEKR